MACPFQGHKSTSIPVVIIVLLFLVTTPPHLLILLIFIFLKSHIALFNRPQLQKHHFDIYHQLATFQLHLSKRVTYLEFPFSLH